MSSLSPKRKNVLLKHPTGRSRRLWLVVICISVITGGVYIVFTPWNIGHLSSHPSPAHNYAEAVQRIEALRDHEAPDMNPVCRLQFMAHGQQVERVIVFVHGYTSCPQQFRELGQRFYDMGYNVYIAPLPHHGLADRLTDEQIVRIQELEYLLIDSE